MTGLIVFAHGSTVESANDGVRRLAAELAKRGGFELVDTAFLDCAPPDLREAVGSLAAQGADRIVIVPFFLTLGIHMRRDLPALLEQLKSTHAGVKMSVAAPLEGHPALIDIMLARVEEVADGGSRSAGQAD